MYNILRGRYNPRLLHDPHSVMRRLNIRYGKTNSQGYWILHCPFYKINKHYLYLHHIDGHYFCNICGIKGKNILGFYMEITGKNFLKASTELGAWENCL